MELYVNVLGMITGDGVLHHCKCPLVVFKDDSGGKLWIVQIREVLTKLYSFLSGSADRKEKGGREILEARIYDFYEKSVKTSACRIFPLSNIAENPKEC